MQSLACGRSVDRHQTVDFEAALAGGENLVVVHVVSLLAVIL